MNARTVPLVVLLVLACGFFLGYLINRDREHNQAMSNVKQENERLQNKIDSLLIEVGRSEVRVDTLWRTVFRVRVKYDTIIAQIPIMEPTEQLTVIDSLTGLDIERSAISESVALIKLPRIERIAVGLVERNKFEKENIYLYQIINEKDGQLTDFKAIVEVQKEQTANVSTQLEICQQQAQDKARRQTVERIAGAGIIVILISLLIN